MEQPKRFKGKVAMNTGGASGIGRACALQLAAEDASVSLADLDGPRALSVRRQIEAGGAAALDVACDVANEDECCQAVQRVASDAVKG